VSAGDSSVPPRRMRFFTTSRLPPRSASASPRPAAAAKAKDCLERFVASGVTNFVEYRAAKAEPERMER